MLQPLTLRQRHLNSLTSFVVMKASFPYTELRLPAVPLYAIGRMMGKLLIAVRR
jgi:hypothetical protein